MTDAGLPFFSKAMFCTLVARVAFLLNHDCEEKPVLGNYKPHVIIKITAMETVYTFTPSYPFY